ncbi:hypothetical protein Daus18300_000487 [Diaporthe australafricana]|uniref:Integral membrane protein TmpA n=1 Tax=Diaporthe australafricana TaxID=127596 RepID=A0ABR3Y3M0_9PEZI
MASQDEKRTSSGSSQGEPREKCLEGGFPSTSGTQSDTSRPATPPELSKLPDQIGSEMSAKFRYKYASSYRKTFATIFTINLAVFIAFMAEARGNPKPRTIGNAASFNLMTSLFFRQEEWVNLCYEVFTMAPHSWPLSVRKRLAKVFHYGGCHSGAGTAAVVWYILYTILVTKEYLNEPMDDIKVDMICSWVLVGMFVIILTSAHPSLRRKFHDYFEAFHRFAGWVALGNFWTHNIFAARVAARQESTSVGLALISSPNFWFICLSTCCSLASWSRLRHVKVYPEKLSDHATRLHFKYRTMQPFYGLKISDKPLTEWHAFATIPDIDPESHKINGFGIVVSNAGDWTKKQISKPNERKLWVRGAPLHGLLYTSRLFKQIVVVATGSGIGPCLSLLYAEATPCRVLWSTRNPQKTYGEKVVAAVQKADPEAIIWNTTERGHPQIVLETYKLVRASSAEAVFVISNPKVTEMVVFGMMSRGIPAYGAIFDS